MSRSSMAKTSAAERSSLSVKKSGEGSSCSFVHQFTAGAMRLSSAPERETSVHSRFRSDFPSRCSPRAADPYRSTDSRFVPAASLSRPTSPASLVSMGCISSSLLFAEVYQPPLAPPPPLLPPPNPPKPPPPDHPPEPPPKPPPKPPPHPRPRPEPEERPQSSGQIHQPLPPPRPPRERSEKTRRITRIEKMLMPPPSCDSRLPARSGGRPESETPCASATYFASCHAASSTPAP